MSTTAKRGNKMRVEVNHRGLSNVVIGPAYRSIRECKSDEIKFRVEKKEDGSLHYVFPEEEMIGNFEFRFKYYLFSEIKFIEKVVNEEGEEIYIFESKK